MSVEHKNGFWVLNTENPEFWSTQSITFKTSAVTSVSLTKAVTKAVDNGIRITTVNSQNGLGDHNWMRYESYEKAEKDYRDIIEILARG